MENMKRIVLFSLFGSNIRSRSNVERIATMVDCKETFVLDMSGVEFVSRSVADELCSISERFHTEIQNSSGIVAKMLDVVSNSRKQKRVRSDENLEIKNFKDFKALSDFLLTI